MAHAIDYLAAQNLVQAFLSQADHLDQKPFLWAKRNGKYQPLLWGQVRDQVLALAVHLKDKGVVEGDRVVIVSENRPEWLIADFAIMACGAITVPAYCTNTIMDHQYILSNCGAKAAITSTKKLAQNLLPAAAQTPSVEFVVTMETASHPDVRIFPWAEMIAKAHPMEINAILKIVAHKKRRDTACIIYTSGTGGAPKGVMLHHGAILKNTEGSYHLLKSILGRKEVFLSFLPLSHSYEHSAGQMFPMTLGAEIYYAEGIDRLSQNMMAARPTIMVAVPRLYEVLHQKIAFGVRKAGGLKEKMFAKAVALGTKRFKAPESLTLREKIQNVFLDLLVRRKVRKKFGGRLNALVSGGAPLNVEVGMFFTALGLTLCQGYGQTESGPVSNCNPPTRERKIHTVGPVLKDVMIKIADDGEVLLKGELVMQGYWGEPTHTAQTVVDGWLHTGDIGQLDEDGHLIITDRKKDIIVNAGGDNISPQRVEGFLTLQPAIHQAMVYGDKQAYLVAVIVPSEESRSDENMVRAAVERVNQKLSQVERVRKFILAAAPFTVDNEMMTPTLKIKRHKIKKKYGAALEALYTTKAKKVG